ncbi:MAG: type II toxin-antitoxin system HicA family toxin [Paludibacteraceae bacterium]|nr:type II toxin-antitoxin system HicA family toxin [Paludibacteraceae bacterium]
MKWSELKRIAIKRGWTLRRHGGRHDIYGHPDKDYYIEIGRHESEEVKNGTANKLLKQIGAK